MERLKWTLILIQDINIHNLLVFKQRVSIRFMIFFNFIGFLTDKFGAYQSGFYFAGVSMVTSSIVVIFPTIFERLNRSKYEIDIADRKVNDFDLAEHIKNETKISSEITMIRLHAR